MRTGLLISGIVLMVIGVAGFLSVQTSASNCASFVGQIGSAISNEMNQQCEMVHGVQIGSAILVVTGLGLTIGGAVAKGRDSKITNWKNPSKYLHDEYNAGYEEARPRDTTINPKEKEQENDNIKYLGILKERLAKGEISKEEYDKLKEEFE